MSLPDWLAALGPVERAVLLPGGASKEAWAVDIGRRGAALRRALGGVIHGFTLSLEQEFRVLQVVHEAGVKVPRPIAYYADLGGREAFAMERVRGETIGRRIVRDPPPGLPEQLAEELAKIHAIPPGRLAVPACRRPGRATCATSSTPSTSRTRRSSSASPGSTSASAATANRSSPTATGGSATSSSPSTGSSTCSTGSSRASPTRPTTSPGRSSAPGASAPTTGASAASATSSRTSSATTS